MPAGGAEHDALSAPPETGYLRRQQRRNYREDIQCCALPSRCFEERACPLFDVSGGAVEAPGDALHLPDGAPQTRGQLLELRVHRLAAGGERGEIAVDELRHLDATGLGAGRQQCRSDAAPGANGGAAR